MTNPTCILVKSSTKPIVKVRLGEDWAIDDVLSFWAGMFKNPSSPTTVGSGDLVDIKIIVKLIHILG